MATRMEISIDDAIDAAAARLGYEEVKSKQREAVRAIVNEKDVFVSLPTGYGKSLCYAMLPFVFDSVLSRPPSTSIVICVSPLVALMQDQKEKFAPRGLTVEYVGASDDSSHERITQGLCQLVYMSPESLICNLHWRELLRTELYQRNLVAVVVDEAHCVKKW